MNPEDPDGITNSGGPGQALKVFFKSSLIWVSKASVTSVIREVSRGPDKKG